MIERFDGAHFPNTKPVYFYSHRRRNFIIVLIVALIFTPLVYWMYEYNGTITYSNLEAMSIFITIFFLLPVQTFLKKQAAFYDDYLVVKIKGKKKSFSYSQIELSPLRRWNWGGMQSNFTVREKANQGVNNRQGVLVAASFSLNNESMRKLNQSLYEGTNAN